MSNIISNPSNPTLYPWVRLWLPEKDWQQQRGLDDDLIPIYQQQDGSTLIEKDLPGLAHLRTLTGVPFLLLLGRPGSGKSSELKSAENEGWFGPNSHFFEAKEIGSSHPGDYISKIIPTGQSARIVIDGLDEALLSNPNFVIQLRAWLRRQITPTGQPFHRLVLSCRWSRPIEHLADLMALWPQDAAKTYILCPLRRCDVINTLEGSYGKEDAQKFWAQLHDRHLKSIACWPQGFLGLMRGFEKSGRQSIAASHGEAIREQVLAHCLLTDSPHDSPRWQSSVANAEWRQRVAGRVAAAMIWSGRALLSLKSTPEQDVLTLGDLNHSDELWDNQRRSLRLEDLDELLRLSSFFYRISGGESHAFTSQVHQEWLAADWLSAQRLDTTRLKLLFGTESGGRWRVFPTLRSVAAWLARMDHDFRVFIRLSDPLTLLWLDAAGLPEDERKEIVDALLEATAKAKVLDPAISQSHLVSLAYPGLAEQLQEWLSRNDVDEAAHELALEIAEKCDAKALAPFLWEKYTQASSQLQIGIAGALHSLAREGFDEQWKAVLRRETPVDIDGTLIGAALDILVVSSSKVPVRDVLDWLVPRIRFGEDGNLFGLYDMIAPKVCLKLVVDDLPATFHLLGSHPDFIHDSHSFAEDLNQSALDLASKHIDKQHVLFAFADYWNACAIQHRFPHRSPNGVWDATKPPFNDVGLRHKVITHLIRHAGYEKATQRNWTRARDWLVLAEDFEWCLDEILKAEEPHEWRYALLIHSLLYQVNLAGVVAEKFNAAAAKSSFLRKQLPQPENTESFAEAFLRDLASRRKVERESSEKREHREAQRELAFQKRLQGYAEELEKEHQDGKITWLGVLRLLSAREHGQGAHSVIFGPEQKISEQESWMREAARRYLFEAPLSEAEDVNEGINGLMALSACWQEFQQPGLLRDVVAERWMPLLYSTLSSFGSFGTAPEGLSVEGLAQSFPAEFATAFGKVIRQRYLAKGSLGELRSLREIWTSAMSQQLLAVLEEKLQPEGFPNAIRALAHFSEAEAMQAGRSWLEKIEEIQSPDAKAALLAACAFLLNGRLAPEVRALLQDTDLVRKATLHATHTIDSIRRRQDFSAWPSQAILELANAVWRAFPKMDVKYCGGDAFFVTGLDCAKSYRDHITQTAATRGLEVIFPVVKVEDEEDATRRQRSRNWHLYRAAEARVGREWKPFAPQTFFHLTARPLARLARDADELLAAVIESLRRWESSLLNGDWHRLWDLGPQKPKHEKIIAKEMRQWLKNELEVLAETEVELATEDRTDILVQITPQNVDQAAITVVIELKIVRAGNKRERETAMKTQLLDYLKQRQEKEGWTHGLYVIAWTAQPGSKDDSAAAIEKAQQHLTEQAASLSQATFTLSGVVLDARLPSKL